MGVSPGQQAPGGGDGASSSVASLLVVEDDTGLAAAIHAVLEEEYYAVTVAATGEEAIEVAQREHFDAALVDLLLPGIGGREVCEALRRIEPGMVILVITALGAPDEILAGFEAGADDYLVKPFGLAEMRARLHALLRRGSQTSRRQGPATPTQVGTGRKPEMTPEMTSEVTPETLVLGEIRFEPASGRAWSDAVPIVLRPRQRAVLELLMRRPGLVLTRRTVRDALWGPHANVSDTALDHHLSGLRRALDAAGAACVIETVYGIGWRLRLKDR